MESMSLGIALSIKGDDGKSTVVYRVQETWQQSFAASESLGAVYSTTQREASLRCQTFPMNDLVLYKIWIAEIE